MQKIRHNGTWLASVFLGLLLFLPCNSASAKNYIQFGILGAYGTHNFNVSAGQAAHYPGWEYGGQIGYIDRLSKGDSNASYGFALFSYYKQVAKENFANSITANEKINGYSIAIVPRIYALQAFIGLGILYSNLQLDTVVSGRASKYTYSGLGYQFELGGDLPIFGRYSALTPRVFYEYSSLTQRGDRSSNRVSQLGISLGLGYNF